MKLDIPSHYVFATTLPENVEFDRVDAISSGQLQVAGYAMNMDGAGPLGK